MGRDRQENVVDPDKRSTSATGQDDTNEIGTQRKRISEERSGSDEASGRGAASMPPPENDAQRANEFDSRKGLAGAEAKGYRGPDDEMREDAQNPGQLGRQSGKQAGAGSTGASHQDSRKREGS